MSKRSKTEEGVQSSCLWCEQQEFEHKKSMTEMETFYKEKLNEATAALKQKEEELKSFKNRVAKMGTSYTKKRYEASCQRREQQEVKHKQSMAKMETSYKKKLNEATAALKQKEMELKTFKNSMAEMETSYKKKLNEATAALKQKEMELKSFKNRVAKMGTSYTKKRYEASCQRCEQQEVKHKQSMAKMETSYKKKLNEATATLKQKEMELKTFKNSCQRCEQQELEHKKSMAEMETSYKKKLNEATATLKQKEEKLKLPKNSMTEMETFYKEKLNEATAALKQKEEELKSFKNRVAGDVAVSIKTGDTESMNNPVSKTRLTEMFDNLRVQQWPKIKDHLKSNDVRSGSTKALIQKVFEDASNQMEQKKKQIVEVFGLIEPSSGRTPQQVKEYRQLAIQNLQMVLFYSKKEDVLKTYLSEYEDQVPQHVRVDFTHLASECYWLGCLMALNNPPLQPDWKNHRPGMDAWDIFPRDITSAADK